MVGRPLGVLVILLGIFVQPRAQSQTNSAPILDSVFIDERRPVRPPANVPAGTRPRGH
jgi:hypothetical protein